LGGYDDNSIELMDGDLGGVDIMSGKEEATDGKSFLFFTKKKKKKKKMEIYMLEVKKPKQRG
jgi:hypothetical protein